jgi:hypothetical protein
MSSVTDQSLKGSVLATESVGLWLVVRNTISFSGRRPEKKRKEKEKVVHSFSACYRRWELYQVLLEFIALSNV